MTMAKGPHESSDPLSVGWAELAAGEWDAARSSFVCALDVQQSPRALEGLSWAAWWLDDGAMVFDARQRAYRLYRDNGDAAGAARMATWLAIDELDFNGAVSVASGWLQRAHRLLDPLARGPEHGWLDFQEGYIARLHGDAARAEQLAARAAALGRRFGVADLEMLGLALQGVTLVARAEVDDGMRCLDEATLLALEGEASVPISGAWACCFLVTACGAAQDYQRAFEWCDRIAEFARRYGSRYMLAFCRAEYGALQLWRGRWREAEALLEAAIEDFSRSRPAMVGAPLAGLAELRRRQGQPREAERLLDRAGPSAAAQLCRARLALDIGDSTAAVALCERLLRQLPEGLKLDRSPGLELLIHALVSGGDFDGAAAALEELRDVERRVGTLPLRARTDMAEAVLLAASGDHDRARSLLEDAVDRFERSGAPYEAAEARIELATALVASGRADAAQREAVLAGDAMAAVGAQPGAERARRLLQASIRRHDGGSPAGDVTPRERDVLTLLAEGLTNQQIAERLVVSEHTIHRHVTNILRKLRLPSRTAAAAYAIRSGLLDQRDA